MPRGGEGNDSLQVPCPHFPGQAEVEGPHPAIKENHFGSEDTLVCQK